MDDRNYRQARHAEPGLDADGLADAPAMQQAIPEAQDMPLWLKAPVSMPAEGGGAFAAFKRAAMFWGASVAALVVVFAGAMWLFDEHGPERPMALESMAAPQRTPAPAAPAQPVARVSALPPLVLLAPAPDATAKSGAPAVVAALPTPPAPALQALKTPEKTAPLAAQLAPKAPAAKPVLAKAAPKASVQPPRKLALAKTAPVQPRAKAAAAKKPALVAKRMPSPAPAKAKAKLLAAVTLPPRARSAEREPQPQPQPAAPAKTHKCLPGELARECEARQ